MMIFTFWVHICFEQNVDVQEPFNISSLYLTIIVGTVTANTGFLIQATYHSEHKDLKLRPIYTDTMEDHPKCPSRRFSNYKIFGV